MSERNDQLVQEMLAILRRGPARTASMSDVADGDAALLLGEDVTNVAPMGWPCAATSCASPPAKP